MIHLLNYKGEIIDFISQKENIVIETSMNRQTKEDVEVFDFTVLSERAEGFNERNRIIVQDRNGDYREFIVTSVSESSDGTTEIESQASYIEDISKAKPFKPGKLGKMTASEALLAALVDTGWEPSEETEWDGIRTTTWTEYKAPYEVLQQLKTTYNMVLDFKVRLGANSVEKREVSLKKANPLFNGKEITHGKDLDTFQRVSDFSEVNTALLAIGPEREDGSRLELVVVDNEAQSQFGLPNRYIWGLYEPESEDQDMTETRLRTLATTELNKRKTQAVSYEISSINLLEQFPHEIVRLGDIVRIKDRTFNPPLYAEAEVIGEEYDAISDTSVYTFGQVVEYKESSLRKYFLDRLDLFTKKANDNINGQINIITDRIDEEVEKLQQKIHRGAEPPANPQDGDFWYDTTNPKVAVLREYKNGQWQNASAHDVEQIGGMTKEAIIFGELSGTFVSISLQNAKLSNEVYEVLNNEYLVDSDIKNRLNDELNVLLGIFSNISSSLDSMTQETATIGKLMDTQAMMIQYRNQAYTLNTTLTNARQAIDARFKLLQSQYTDEKYNEAMQKVADVIGGTYNAETGQLIADIPSKEALEEMRVTIEESMNNMSQENAKKLQELQNGITQTNQRITNTEEELSAGITSVTKKVDGMQVGGRNLLKSFTDNDRSNINANIVSTQSFIFSGWATQLYSADYLKNVLEEGKTYTLSYELEITELATSEMVYSKNHGLLFHVANGNSSMSINTQKELEREIGNKMTVKHTFTIETLYDYRLIGYTGRYTGDGTVYGTPVTFNNTRITNLKLEEGNVATAWTPAPEDTQASIAQARQEAEKAAQAYADAQDNLKEIEVKAYADGIVDAEEQRAIDDAAAKLAAAKTYAEQKATEAKNAANTNTTNQLAPIKTTINTQSADIKVLKDGIKLKADSTEVTKIYDDYLTPLQTQVNAQKATLDVLPSQIAAKVSQSTYTADMNNIVGRLNTSDTERTQLSNEIKDRVTLNEYNNMKVGTENLLLNSLYQDKSTSTSLTYAFFRYYLTTPLKVGKTYTFTCDFNTTDANQSGRASVRGYAPDNGLIDVDIVEGKIKVTFVAKVASETFLVYKDVAGTSPHTLNVNVTNAMLVEGDKIGDYQQAPQESAERLTTMETSISQNGQEIILRAKKEDLNKTKQTLSKVIADLTVNTTDGITLSYDENGSISSHTVGPDGIKIKGDKVNIQANSDFSVLVGNVNGKVGKDEIINRLNLSPEGLDINVNNVGIRGGNAQDYITIQNNQMLSYGVFERSWAGNKDTAKLELGIKDGRVLIRNQNTGYRLYLTERGLSTMMDGFSDDTSGTLEFHSQRFNETSRGITMHSTYGAVALLSEQSRIYSRSRLTNNIESFDYGVYIRPYMNSRPGVNEFNFYIKDNDGAGNTDGCVLFGEVSEASGLAGSGIRFKKAGVRGYENMESIVYATDNVGNIGTGSFYADKLYGDWKAKTSNLYAMVDGEFRVTDFNGATGTNGSINYAPIRIGTINSMSGAAFANHSGGNVYFGVGLNELRVTNNNHYNGGNIGYKPVKAQDFLKSSSVKYKKDIKIWDYDALSVVTDELQLYSYKYKDDIQGLMQHGPIIGDGYDTPPEFIFGDGINTNEMLSFALRAIQQLNEKINILEEKLNG